MDFPIYYYLVVSAAILVVVGVLVVWRLRGTSRPTSKNSYVEALQFLVDGDRNTAFEKLQEAVRAGVAPTDAYVRLGNLLRERGEVSKAMQIHQSLTVKPNLSRAEEIKLYLSLAEDHAKMGSSEKSVRVLESVIKRSHVKDADVYRSLAKHLHVLGQHERAYDVLKEAKKLGGVGDRELALYLTSAAESLFERGHPRDAKRMLQRALKHDPKCAPCLLVLGDIAAGESHLDVAINHWKQVAVLSPELAATVLDKLESTLFERGRFSEIEKVYDDVRTARRSDEAAHVGLAGFYKKQGRGEEAITLLEDYLTVHPESVAASLLLTSFYARHRDVETLERFLDESLQDPQATSQFECGTCHLRSDVMRWHCPRCNSFDSFSTNHHEM